MKLWAVEDCAAWHAALERYPDVIRAQGVTRLEELDRWYREGLPAPIAGRTPPYVTRDELERVTSWKMKRGVWRERNRQLVRSNDPTLVERVSKEAFAAVPDTRKPVALLST